MPESCIVCKDRARISFSVPKHPYLLKNWMDALNLETEPRVGSRVCFRHFKYEDIVKNGKNGHHMLLKDSVPNLQDNYGTNSDFSYEWGSMDDVIPAAL